MKENRVILDTDIGSDVSDLMAAFLYWKCAKQGLLYPQGILMNTGNEQGLKCLALAAKYVCGKETSIGALGTSFLNYSMNWKYTSYLIKAYQLNQLPETMPYLAYFRKALAEAPDHSVTIVCNGPMRGLAQLLRSQPDSYSSLNGHQLVYQKVNKLIVASGRFRAKKKQDYPRRSGWDVWSYADTSIYIDWDVLSARVVDDEWPTPILWVGCEVGYLHLSGKTFYDKAPEDHPLKLAYQHFTKGSAHVSGPQLAVLCSIPQFEKQIRFSRRGRILMNDEGHTELRPYAGGRDRHVRIDTPDSVFRQIDQLLLS